MLQIIIIHGSKVIDPKPRLAFIGAEAAEVAASKLSLKFSDAEFYWLFNDVKMVFLPFIKPKWEGFSFFAALTLFFTSLFSGTILQN